MAISDTEPAITTSLAQSEQLSCEQNPLLSSKTRTAAFRKWLNQ